VPVQVVAEAATGQAAIREALLHRPDVVVMDLQMPEGNGVEATRELRQVLPSAAVLVLTMFDDDDSVCAAMRAGARGYVLRGAEQHEIARAITAVAAGEAIFGPAVATLGAGLLHHPTARCHPFPQLTSREREVLDLLAAGRSNQPDRPAAGLERQDGRRPPLQYLRQAPGGRPQPSHPARPRRRPRPPLTSQAAPALPCQARVRSGDLDRRLKVARRVCAPGLCRRLLQPTRINQRERNDVYHYNRRRFASSRRLLHRPAGTCRERMRPHRLCSAG